MNTKSRIMVIFSVLFLILYSIFHSPIAEGHLIGQLPFFKINDQYSNLYPTPLTSLYNFDLPQDLAPENYLINQLVNFELDTTKLPAPPEIIAKTKFNWDFTDGTHAQGLENQHKFIQPGSYILKIYADDGTTPKPQLLESVLVNILPNSNYKLPKARILVNGQESKDPLTDILTLDFKNPIQFDASLSFSSNSIVEYFWDFGDQKSSSSPIQTHSYPKDLSQVFVVLRVKDAQGLLSDNFVEIQNAENNNQNPSTSSASVAPIFKLKPTKPNQLLTSLIGLTILGVIIFTVRQWLLVRRHGKHQ